MIRFNHADSGPALLLLNRSAGWFDSVRREAAGLRLARLLCVSDARDAVALLCCGERFSHLLIHPPAADGLLAPMPRAMLKPPSSTPTTRSP